MNIDSNTTISHHSSSEFERARRDMGDMEFNGQRQTFAKGQDLFAEGDPAEFFYRIVYGSVGSSKLLSDARRQIDSFHLAGDIFGYEYAKVHSVTATALEDTKVVVFPL